MERFLGIYQDDQQKHDHYSFIKGVESLVVKSVAYPLAAICTMVEGVVRIILAGVTYLADVCCGCESCSEVSGNFWESALSCDRSDSEMTALKVFLIGVAVPFSDFVELICKIAKSCLGDCETIN